VILFVLLFLYAADAAARGSHGDAMVVVPCMALAAALWLIFRVHNLWLDFKEWLRKKMRSQ
jgi:hypothetical protein